MDKTSIANQFYWHSLNRYLNRTTEDDLKPSVKTLKKFGNFPEFTGEKTLLKNSANLLGEKIFDSKKGGMFSCNFYGKNIVFFL